MEELSSGDWNLMIRLINDNESRKKAAEFFSEEQLVKYFDPMKKELKEMRKEDPKAAFWPVESDW